MTSRCLPRIDTKETGRIVRCESIGVNVQKGHGRSASHALLAGSCAPCTHRQRSELHRIFPVPGHGLSSRGEFCMQRRTVAIGLTALPLVLWGCASQKSMADPLVGGLTKSLERDGEPSHGRRRFVLTLAQEKLSSGQFNQSGERHSRGQQVSRHGQEPRCRDRAARRQGGSGQCARTVGNISGQGS